MRTLLALSLLAPAAAHAFCGTYMGGAGAELYNHKAQVAYVRQGNQTTLTLFNDVEGNTDTFAMVVPVPVVLQQGDVQLVSSHIFDRLDTYSSPRHVDYDCPSTDSWGNWGDTSDSGSAPQADTSDSDVTIEEQFLVGEYEITVLSATESLALITWLNSNGYAVSSDANTMLGEYIAQNMYFFAARVVVGASPDTGLPGPVDTAAGVAGELQPLRFSFPSTDFGLPIRLGTLNSPGVQDLFVYVIGDSANGYAEVTNYPEATPEDECMWMGSDWPDFGSFYEQQFSDAIDVAGGNAWVREYSWNTGGCDPCSTTPLNTAEVNELGFVGSSNGSYTTRLHLRYGADVPTDLQLAFSGSSQTSQMRYIDYEWEQEEDWPICGAGFASPPGTCDGLEVVDTSIDVPPHTGDSETGEVGETDDSGETAHTGTVVIVLPGPETGETAHTGLPVFGETDTAASESLDSDDSVLEDTAAGDSAEDSDVDTDVEDSDSVDSESVDTEVVDTEVLDTDAADTDVADTDVADTDVADTDATDSEPPDVIDPGKGDGCGSCDAGGPGTGGWLVLGLVGLIRRRR